MSSSGSIVFLVALLGLVAPIGLYYLVRTEHTKREQMDRAAAEQTARRDTNEEK